MQKKFQVFVSSTYEDLVEERQDTLKSILDLGHIPSGMEGFFAADEDQFEYIKKIIDECDYYVLIIAGRYGSVDEMGLSYTEKEYDYAVSKGVTVLAFVHNDVGSLPAVKVDREPHTLERLQAFKKKVTQRRLVSFWKDREQLKANIIISLSKAMTDAPGTGWARGDIVANEDVLAQLNEFRNETERLTKENEQLRNEMRPKIADIAKLNELFPLRYDEWDANKRYRTPKIVQVTWREVFKTIGPSYFSPAQKAMIEYLLKRLIAERDLPRVISSSRIVVNDTGH